MKAGADLQKNPGGAKFEMMLEFIIFGMWGKMIFDIKKCHFVFFRISRSFHKKSKRVWKVKGVQLCFVKQIYKSNPITALFCFSLHLGFLKMRKKPYSVSCILDPAIQNLIKLFSYTCWKKNRDLCQDILKFPNSAQKHILIYFVFKWNISKI